MRLLAFVAISSAALAAACSSTPTPTPPVATSAPPPTSASAVASAAPHEEFDPCKGKPPIDKKYHGILRTARCDQERFLKMSDVATWLGVECSYCHVKDPNDPKKEIYPPMTPKKEIADWMSMHLMQAVKRADGQPMTCKSCHTDDQGKPVAKILGNPRDPIKAQEWMSLVMVNKFVAADGSKLKCKSCHVGNFSTPEWHAKVIGMSDQLPKHEVP